MSVRHFTFQRRPYLTLALIGLAWAVVVIGFQALVPQRITLKRPDYATAWTATETGARSQSGKPYLLEPFMNRQVSWDSEFYLSIAVGGYDDPLVKPVPLPDHPPLSKNYAFFPLYPLAMRVVAAPLRAVTDLNAIGAASLAGVLVALAGAIGAMIALYDLVRGELGDEGGLRTAFYLLIFPSGFFLAQVFSEGLFIGLAFGALALIRRGKLWPAALLAGLAVLTRSTGVVLVIPLALGWLIQWWSHRWTPTRADLVRAAAILVPLAAFALWWWLLGDQFSRVEDTWFGRSLTDWDRTREGWQTAIDALRDAGTRSEMRVYFGLEFAAVILAALACLATLRRYPGAALFGLAMLGITAASGAPQSLIRYVLAVPSLFICLGRWGQRSAVFDRAWTTASLLLLGLLVTLFTFDMWVA